MEGPVDLISEPGFIFMLTARTTLCVYPDGVIGVTLNLMPRRHNVCVCVNFAACPVVVVWIVQCCCGTKGVCSEDS